MGIASHRSSQRKEETVKTETRRKIMKITLFAVVFGLLVAVASGFWNGILMQKRQNKQASNQVERQTEVKTLSKLRRLKQASYDECEEVLGSCLFEEFGTSNWEDLKPRQRLDCCIDHWHVCIGFDI